MLVRMRTSFLWVSILCAGASLGAAGCGRTGLDGSDVLEDGDHAGVGGTSTGNSGGMTSTGGSAPSEMPLELFPETLPAARISHAYSALFTASGGVGAPYRFRLVEGELPPGIDLAADGKLEGAPTQGGEFSFRVGVHDLGGNEAERDYVLQVSGPRFLAYTTFISSTSTRSAVKIVDVTRTTLAPVTLLDEDVGGIAFSPDGRWLSFYNFEGPSKYDVYLVNTAGESPGPLVPLLDEGRIDKWWSYTWSPDATAIAYIKVSGARLDLWTVDVLADNLGQRRLLAEGVAAAGLSWLRADTLSYLDAQLRPNFLHFGDSGSFSRTIADAPGAVVMSMAHDQELAFAGGSAGFALIDSETGAMQALDGFSQWSMAPTFDFAVARKPLGEFGVFAIHGTKPELLVRSGDSATDFKGPYFANAAPRFVQEEDNRFVVTAVDGSLVSVHEIAGAYASPSFGYYTPDDRMFVFSDATALWASAQTSDAPAEARKLSDFGASPGMFLSPDSRWALATAGSPQVARLVPLDESSTDPLRDLSQGLEWGMHYWAADSQTIATLGGEPQVGRVLQVRRLADQMSAPVVIASCKGAVATTACPNTVVFQP